MFYWYIIIPLNSALWVSNWMVLYINLTYWRLPTSGSCCYKSYLKKKRSKHWIVFNNFDNLFCCRIFPRTKIFGVSLRFYLQIQTEMARNSYLPWKVNRPNTCTKCRLYLYVHVLCNFKIRKCLSIFFSPLIFCSHLACDLNIDLHFIYITLMTSVDHILIISPQQINILYMLYNGIQRRTTLCGSQKLTSTMMPMPSEYLSILQISL